MPAIIAAKRAVSSVAGSQFTGLNSLRSLLLFVCWIVHICSLFIVLNDDGDLLKMFYIMQEGVASHISTPPATRGSYFNCCYSIRMPGSGPKDILFPSVWYVPQEYVRVVFITTINYDHYY